MRSLIDRIHLWYDFSCLPRTPRSRGRHAVPARAHGAQDGNPVARLDRGHGRRRRRLPGSRLVRSRGGQRTGWSASRTSSPAPAQCRAMNRRYGLSTSSRTTDPTSSGEPCSTRWCLKYRTSALRAAARGCGHGCRGHGSHPPRPDVPAGTARHADRRARSLPASPLPPSTVGSCWPRARGSMFRNDTSNGRSASTGPVRQTLAMDRAGHPVLRRFSGQR